MATGTGGRTRKTKNEVGWVISSTNQANALVISCWWLASGLRGEWRLDWRSTGLVGGLAGLALGSLWWTDLRHTVEVEGLGRASLRFD